MDLVVGCYHDSAYAVDAGSVWIFTELGGTLGRVEATAELWTADVDNYLGTAVGFDRGILYAVASRRSETVELGGTLYAVPAWASETSAR